MRSRPSRRPPEPRAAVPPDTDMTPMIDVTFQLVVFFLVANDLSRREITDLRLPTAVHAREESPAGGLRVVVNVRPPGAASTDLPSVTVAGRTLDLGAFSAELRLWADRARPGGPGAPSELRALVRADTDVPWRHVQLVLQACAAPRIAIHRVEFATRLPADSPSTRAVR